MSASMNELPDELRREVLINAMDTSPQVASMTAAELARNTLALVLCGGRGSRLGALTDWRAKPAVPFGSRFRLVDFTLANCVNSGIRRIGVLTQYKAHSLIRHIEEVWLLNRRFGDFVELLPAQQRVRGEWYAGTADAVFQNIDIVRQHRPAFVLVLGGDHVYKMNYTVLLAEHVANNAEITVGCVDVPIEEASAFGVMRVDAHNRVIGFDEKPSSPTPMPGSRDRVLASMGIYVFNTATLFQELTRDATDEASAHDFGRDLVPHMVGAVRNVYAHTFGRSCVGSPASAPYWRDVGTLDAYWDANIELTRNAPRLDLFDPAWPIPTGNGAGMPSQFLPDEKGRQGVLAESIIGSGCVIGAAEIRRSVLFSDIRVHDYAQIDQSVVLSEVEVGRGVTLKRAIVDKYCKVPAGLSAGVNSTEDRRRFHVTPAGITLITPEMLGQRAWAPSETDATSCGMQPLASRR